MTEIYIVPITKTKLDSIPEDVRLFVVHIGHIRNELMTIQKLLLASQQYTMTDEIQISMRAYQSLMLARLLAGKLWEAWQLFSTSYFKSKLYLNYENRLDLTGQKAIAALKKFFGPNELIKNVRNHFAFHYSAEQISAALANLEEPFDLKIYLSEQSGNTYFQISETIVNTAMLDDIEKGDYEASLRKLMDQALTASNDFVKFFDSWLTFVLREYFPEITSPDKLEKLTLSNLAKVDTIGFDYFLEEPLS